MAVLGTVGIAPPSVRTGTELLYTPAGDVVSGSEGTLSTLPMTPSCVV